MGLAPEGINLATPSFISEPEGATNAPAYKRSVTSISALRQRSVGMSSDAGDHVVT